MKIFSAAQIKECDASTIKASRITSADLMERAATRCVDWLKSNFSREALFVVLCGPGNNGGDGLAIARLLHQRGYGVKAFLLNFGKELSPDCAANLQRLQQKDAQLVTVVEPGAFITDLPQHVVLVDAILGSGLSRPVEGWVAAFIERVNKMTNHKVAIDIPSGLPADIAVDGDTVVLRANDTLTFQLYKRCFLHPESAPAAGNLHIIDIGLDKEFIQATHTQYRTLEREDVLSFFKVRNPFAHKGMHGSVLLAGGSYGKIGAMVLTTKAALRSGAGLVTALVPECGYNIMQTAVPEAMCLTNGAQSLEAITNWEHFEVMGLGPGMGTTYSTAQALSAFLEACKEPVVLDADALNIIAANPDLLGKLPKNSVITPHPREFSRLFGDNTNTMIQVDNARIQAMRYNINIVLKGHHTAIINTEGECWYNMTGNAGMATGGSGDVLTGIITGLMAQGYTPQQAALLGVYLCGMAGDLAAKALSQEALVAGDIIDYIGKAFITLQ